MQKESVEKTNPLGRGLRYKVCDICGEKVKSQGYGGHLFLQHNVKTGVVARLEELERRLDGSGDAGAHPNSNPDTALQEIEERLERLEGVRVHSVAKSGQVNGRESSLEVIDDLAGKLGDYARRLEELEDFNARILGRKGLFADDVSLMMKPEDWEKIERAGVEDVESEEDEGDEGEEGEGKELRGEKGKEASSGSRSKSKEKKDKGGGFWPWDDKS